MIKKRIIPLRKQDAYSTQGEWLNLESSAEIELTSEHSEHPIDSAIIVGESGDGWRASSPGEQKIRICFTEPQTIKRIYLVFEETDIKRTQQFVVRWAPDGAEEQYREAVRQQYNFSPPDTTDEVETFNVNLIGVKDLEIEITPDISGGDAHASLKILRLG